MSGDPSGAAGCLLSNLETSEGIGQALFGLEAGLAGGAVLDSITPEAVAAGFTGEDITAASESSEVAEGAGISGRMAAGASVDATSAAAKEAGSAGAEESGPVLGGAYRDIEANGGEVHHMTADSISTLSRGDGPAIWMETADHRLTASWGSSTEAQEYRAAQAKLISQGKLDEAVQMDINDIQSKFGSKYDAGIQQMLDYYKAIPAWKVVLK